MTDVHKDTISTCYKSLVDNLVVDDVVNHLRSSIILTPRNAEDIQQSGGISKKAETLLNILLRKPDVAFDKLVEALNSTRQTHLANLLVREGKTCIMFAPLSLVVRGYWRNIFLVVSYHIVS